MTLKQHNDKMLQLLYRNTEISILMVRVSKLIKSYLLKIVVTDFFGHLLTRDRHKGMLVQVAVILQSSKIILCLCGFAVRIMLLYMYILIGYTPSIFQVQITSPR